MSIIDNVRNIRISDYNYPLPDERIAKHPLAQREQCKLLYYKSGEPIKEYQFLNIPQLLPQISLGTRWLWALFFIACLKICQNL